MSPVLSHFVPDGRASSTVFVSVGYLWVIAGKAFSSLGKQMVVRYDLTRYNWEVVNVRGPKPEGRYGHTATLHGVSYQIDYFCQ